MSSQGKYGDLFFFLSIFSHTAGALQFLFRFVSSIFLSDSEGVVVGVDVCLVLAYEHVYF